MRQYIYTVIVCATILVGCSSPKAMFNYDQKDKTAPANVQFENKSSKADTYMWDFGDGMTSISASPEHRYVLSGKYTVQLIATKGGKTSIEKKELFFEAPSACLLEMQTNMGTMTIQLYDDTPKHRDNFIKLAESGFYDGLLYHRVINGFMIQGGDPQSKGAAAGQQLGSGGPGYKVDAEFNPAHVHVKGALAAARQGGPSNPKKKSSGSQFYIVQGKPVSKNQLEQLAIKKGITYSEEQTKTLMEEGGTPFLDMDYTVYGIVVKGLDVIDKIAAVKTNKSDRPTDDVVIEKVRVIK